MGILTAREVIDDLITNKSKWQVNIWGWLFHESNKHKTWVQYQHEYYLTPLANIKGLKLNWNERRRLKGAIKYWLDNHLLCDECGKVVKSGTNAAFSKTTHKTCEAKRLSNVFIANPGLRSVLLAEASKTDSKLGTSIASDLLG